MPDFPFHSTIIFWALICARSCCGCWKRTGEQNRQILCSWKQEKQNLTNRKVQNAIRLGKLSLRNWHWDLRSEGFRHKKGSWDFSLLDHLRKIEEKKTKIRVFDVLWNEWKWKDLLQVGRLFQKQTTNANCENIPGWGYALKKATKNWRT